jgi:hypothetical protein
MNSSKLHSPVNIGLRIMLSKKSCQLPNCIRPIGGCRKSQNEELNSMYTSPHIIRLFKSKQVRQLKRVISMVKLRNANRT